VLDQQSMPVQIPQQQGAFKIVNVVQYPAVPVVKDLNNSHPITRGLDSLILPFVSPIQVSSSSASSVTVLARSSMLSWAVPPGKKYFQKLDPFDIDPPDYKDWKGPFTLAVAIQGPPRLAVIGTSRFAGMGNFKPPESNEDFLLNLADWLSYDEDLIAIRSKAVAFHLLREVSPVASGFIHYTDLYLPPLIMVLAGLLRLHTRRRRRALVRKEYAMPQPASVP